MDTLSAVLLATLVSYGNSNLLQSCPSLDLAGSIVTKQDTALKGHVRQSLPNVSWIQCSLRCQRQHWCISINFQNSLNTGRCELNDYGVQDEMSASKERQFERKPGFIYTQLKPAEYGCHSNTCQNGGTCKLDCTSTKVNCICPNGYQGNACEIDINECSSNPCLHGGTCTDLVNGYNCTCVIGYEGLQCQTVSKCSLYWPNAVTTNLVNADWTATSFVSALTISFWLKVPSSYNDELFPFTYATTSESSAVHVKIKNNADVDLIIMGDTKTMATNFQRDSTWQHGCITWNRLDRGMVKFYKNGVWLDRKEGMSESKPITSGGKLIIGQRQGSYGSNFDDQKLMVGHMTELNIWSRVFSSAEVANLSTTCHAGLEGDIVSWSDVQQGTLQGNVQKICPSSCP